MGIIQPNADKKAQEGWIYSFCLSWGIHLLLLSWQKKKERERERRELTLSAFSLPSLTYSNRIWIQFELWDKSQTLEMTDRKPSKCEIHYDCMAGQEPGLGCLNPTFARDYILVLNYSITNYIFKRTYKLTILIEFFLKIEKHVTLWVDEYLLWLLYLFDPYF